MKPQYNYHYYYSIQITECVSNNVASLASILSVVDISVTLIVYHKR